MPSFSALSLSILVTRYGRYICRIIQDYIQVYSTNDLYGLGVGQVVYGGGGERMVTLAPIREGEQGVFNVSMVS